MTIINEIRAALDTHLSGTVGIPTIANQNVAFKPTVGTPFIKADFVPTGRQPAVRGLNPQQRYDGLYNILISTPENMGAGAGYDIADLLLNRFNSTTYVEYSDPTDALLLESGSNLLLEDSSKILVGNSLFITIEYSEVRTSFLDSPFYNTPVVVSWYTYF